jgi:hypothetical protein
MPHFFFHFREARELSIDPEGEDLPDQHAARAEAIIAIRDILSERLMHDKSLDDCAMEITDEDGCVLDMVDARNVLFQNGRLRVYRDDMGEPAPMSPD